MREGYKKHENQMFEKVLVFERMSQNSDKHLSKSSYKLFRNTLSQNNRLH